MKKILLAMLAVSILIVAPRSASALTPSLPFGGDAVLVGTTTVKIGITYSAVPSTGSASSSMVMVTGSGYVSSRNADSYMYAGPGAINIHALHSEGKGIPSPVGSTFYLDAPIVVDSLGNKFYHLRQNVNTRFSISASYSVNQMFSGVYTGVVDSLYYFHDYKDISNNIPGIWREAGPFQSSKIYITGEQGPYITSVAQGDVNNFKISGERMGSITGVIARGFPKDALGIISKGPDYVKFYSKNGNPPAGDYFIYAESPVGDSNNIYFHVGSKNVPPVIGPWASPTTIVAGQAVKFTWTATDANKDNLVWAVNWGDTPAVPPVPCSATQPGYGNGWTYNKSHTWMKPGNYKVTVSVSDCVGGVDSTHFTAVVVASGTTTPVNVPPVMGPIAGPVSIKAGEMANFTFTATDANNDNLFWGEDWGDASGGKEDCSPSQNRKGWQKTLGHVWSKPGNYPLKFSVYDCLGGSDLGSFTASVVGVGTTTLPTPYVSGAQTTSTSISNTNGQVQVYNVSYSFTLTNPGSSDLYVPTDPAAFVTYSVRSGNPSSVINSVGPMPAIPGDVNGARIVPAWSSRSFTLFGVIKQPANGSLTEEMKITAINYGSSPAKQGALAVTAGLENLSVIAMFSGTPVRTITITNTTSTYVRGQDASLLWTTQGILSTDMMKISLYKGGSLVSVPAGAPSGYTNPVILPRNTGSFVIPAQATGYLPAGNDYQIKIETMDGQVSTMSPNFSLVNQTSYNYVMQLSSVISALEDLINSLR